MTKLRIEHGASRIRWVPLKSMIEEPIAADIEQLCEWSQNERRYVVNELLRFALTQDEAFQKYKAESQTNAKPSNVLVSPAPVTDRVAAQTATNDKPAIAVPAARPQPGAK